MQTLDQWKEEQGLHDGFKEQVVSTPVSTKTTIMDSMPARAKKNPLSNDAY